MSMDSYLRQPSPPSSLNGGLTLSTARPFTHDLEPSGPPSDHPTPYVRQSGVTHNLSQESQALPGETGQPGNSTRSSDMLADCLTTLVGPSGAPESTYEQSSTEGRHKDSRPPKPHELKRLHVVELVWPAKAKSSARFHPHSAQKGKVKFTFNVAKYGKIFDELFKHSNIKLSHTITSVEELKGCVYCKWHDSFLHNTNDCVVFRRQIQSTINEGWLRFHEVKIDRP